MLMNHTSDGYRGRRRSVVLLVYLLALSAGCIPRQPPAVFQAITNTVPPCWHEICPGVTTRQQVLQILGNLPEVDRNQVAELSI